MNRMGFKPPSKIVLRALIPRWIQKFKDSTFLQLPRNKVPIPFGMPNLIATPMVTPTLRRREIIAATAQAVTPTRHPEKRFLLELAGNSSDAVLEVSS